MKVISYAPEAVRYINGFFCVFKPAGLSMNQMRTTLKKNICRDLNEMEVRPPKQVVLFEGSVTSGKALSVKMQPSLADNPLVLGPRHQPQDIRCKNLNFMGYETSGVTLFAINDGCAEAADFMKKPQLQVIEAKGKFGFATDTCFKNGKVIERSTYNHVSQVKLDRIIASIQANHQSEAYKYSGIHLQTQAAYDMACKGIVKPDGKSPPLLYNICCTEFDPPYFTLKIHCVYGEDEFLAGLIHEIGIHMKSAAACSQIRQIQYGHFTLDHTLLRKHWTVENIISNIVLVKKIRDMQKDSPHIGTISKDSIDKVLQDMQEDARADVL